MSTLTFDVLVVGAGPGGYVAAIRAAQLGFSVACCEGNAYDDPKGAPRLGGTCLNVGCIPSKALLHTSHLFYEAAHHFAKQGIVMDAPKIDVPAMMARKDKIVAQLTSGIASLFQKNKVTFLKGQGAFLKREAEAWLMQVGEEKIIARHVIIATGSAPRHLPDLTVDQQRVCDNAGALAFDEVPQKLAILGAGVIGLEMGSIWARFGSEVTVLESLPQFLPMADADIAKAALKTFTQQGLAFHFGITITKVTSHEEGVVMNYLDQDGKAQTLNADRLILSIGRTPNTQGLNAEAVGLLCTDRGHLVVDEQCRTNLPHVFAIGDVTDGPMLAHKASEEGVLVAEVMAGQAGSRDFSHIPYVIYTQPEIAWVGKTEAALKAEGVDYRVGTFPFAASGRALGSDAKEGFVKMIAHTTSDRILGVHIYGAQASELIGQAAQAMAFGAASEDIARICHAHPTLSEALHEAALAVDGRSLHR